MLVPGETILVITKTGPTYDPDGYYIEGKTVKKPVHGCVIVPKGAAVEVDNTYRLASNEVSVLCPRVIRGIDEGATLIIRGEEYEVSAPPFDHVSPFGTGRGGTEIPAERRVTT